LCILKKIIWPFFLFLNDFLSSLFCKKNDDKLNNKQRVLIIRLDAIGDSIIWLDSAKEYRTIYPPEKYHLTLLCNQTWESIAEQLPYFDKVISLNKKKFYRNLFYRSNMLRNIKTRNFDIVIQPTFSREFHLGDSIIRASNAKQRIGFMGDLSNITYSIKNISDKWYTKLIPASNEVLMELERNAEFMRGLGLNNFQCSVPSWPIKSEYVIPTLNKYFVIFPGASNRKRAWSPKSFSKIISKIHQKTGWNAVICGGSGEEDLGKEIICLTEDAITIDLIGKTNLLELGEVIRNSQLLIGNETSAIHMAAAVRVPSICILGGGHFGRFMPYNINGNNTNFIPKPVFNKMECFNCNWKCIYENSNQTIWPCIYKVSINDVWDEVLKIIEEGEDNNGNKPTV
jgi:ADP-heptose:LPS heptosyltransferase